MIPCYYEGCQQASKFYCDCQGIFKPLCLHHLPFHCLDDSDSSSEIKHPIIQLSCKIRPEIINKIEYFYQKHKNQLQVIFDDFVSKSESILKKKTIVHEQIKTKILDLQKFQHEIMQDFNNSPLKIMNEEACVHLSHIIKVEEVGEYLTKNNYFSLRDIETEIKEFFMADDVGLKMKYDETINRLESELVEKCVEILDLREELTKALNEKNEIEEENNVINKFTIEIQKTLHERDEEITSLNEEIKNLKENQANHDENLENNDGEISRCKIKDKIIAEKTNLNFKLSQELKKLEKELTELKEDKLSKIDLPGALVNRLINGGSKQNLDLPKTRTKREEGFEVNLSKRPKY